MTRSRSAGQAAGASFPKTRSRPLRRASVSVVLNIAEGSGRVRKPDADRHRAIARGSAMECAAILDVCRVLVLVDATRLDEARTLLVRVVQMLCRMCG